MSAGLLGLLGVGAVALAVLVIILAGDRGPRWKRKERQALKGKRDVAYVVSFARRPKDAPEIEMNSGGRN